MSENKENELENVIDKLDLSLLIQENDVKIYKETDTIYDIINTFLEKNYSDEAFYIVDLGKIIKQVQLWRNLLPRVEIFYAMKCNPDPLICRVLASLNVSFDCASKSEIAGILSITNNGDKIIFANPIKMPNQIKYASANDVNMMTFDSDYELYKIKLYFPNAQLVLRIAVDDSKSVCKFNCKFGCNLNEVEKILTLAKTMNLNIIGTSFHVGSKCNDANQYYNAIKDARTVFDIAKKVGYNMTLLNLGGGYTLENIETGITFEKTTEFINRGIDDFFNDIENLRIIAETGRFIVSNAGIAVLSIIGKKELLNENDEKQFIYYVNDGVYSTFNNIIYDKAKIEIKPFNQKVDQQLYKTTIFGPTCDSIDKIAENILLQECQIADTLIVPNMGDYTISASGGKFNGFPPPKIFYIMTTSDI